MTSNNPGTCDWLANEIALSHLMDRPALDPIVAEFKTESSFADATALAEHLVKIGRLTAFQATRLLEGQGRGLVLGPYVLVDVAGSGSMGTVYKALGRADHKAYAIKVLPVRSPWNVRQARKRLQQFPEEANPAVVPWLDVGTSAGLHYLVWPFAEGETLEANVRRDGLLSPARAAAIGVQLAQATQWCERNRVWHGAIKPANVMLGSDGQAKLLDFGVGVLLAGAEEESLVDTMAESAVLTALVDCTAPECVIDPSKRSVRGDQYSLGCTLYFGLTGRYPFSNGTTTEKMLAHQREEPTPVTALNPGVPAPLAAAIDRLMQKAPEARYNHTDELISALTPLAKQSVVYVPPPSAPTPPLRQTDTPSRASASLLTAQTPWPKTPPPTIARTPRPSVAKIPSPAPAPVVEKPEPPPPATHRPVAIEKPAPDALPRVLPPDRPFAESFMRKLMFWKTWEDPVACTLLAPSGVLPGETATVQVVMHHTNRSEQAKTLPDWRGTQELPEQIERGESIGFNLAVHDVDIGKPLGQIEWNGYSVATMFTVRVPPDWPPGQTLQGMLTIGRRQTPVGKLQFELPVAAGQGVS